MSVLKAVRDGQRLIVEVQDPSRRVPYLLGESDDFSESGRGLMIVDKIAADRGVRLIAQGGKVIWFELLAWPRP